MRPDALIEHVRMRSHSGIVAVLSLVVACEPQPSQTATSLLGQARVASQTGPVAVVRFLATRDTAGDRLSFGFNPDADSAYVHLICWIPAENCETDEPGWDTFSVVSGFDIEALWIRGDSAQIEARFPTVAIGNGLTARRDTVRWRPLLQREGGRWRVVSPESQKMPLPSIATALRRLARTRADTALLTQPPLPPEP